MEAAAAAPRQSRLPRIAKAAAAGVGLAASVVGILASLGLVGGGSGGVTSPASVGAVPRAAGTTLDRYDAPQFSLRYPRGWRVSSRDGADGSSTTIASPDAPGVLLRVDVTPDSIGAEATMAAQALAIAAQGVGYRNLGIGATTISGIGGVRWDYLLRDHGVELRRVEIVFSDARGNGYALVEQAPSGVFSRWRNVFDDVADSLVPAGA